MALAERQKLYERIEAIRGGRRLVALCNFDRTGYPELPGLKINFQSDLKSHLYRVLRGICRGAVPGIDLLLYTRGGDVNSVWPIVSLLREFDADFQVLVPYRAHSAGTMVALASKRIVMTRIAELSPIDPTVGNAFNPKDGNQRLGISVEDVRAYESFVRQVLQYPERQYVHGEAAADGVDTDRALLRRTIDDLIGQVHPLALGNVHRVYQQIGQLARELLNLHPVENRNAADVVDRLTTKFYSHMHMINRQEATTLLGAEHCESSSAELEDALMDVLAAYNADLNAATPFIAAKTLGDASTKAVRFVGGVVECVNCGYVFETKLSLSQSSELPPNVQIQLPAGQPLPILPGLPRRYVGELISQGWIENEGPKGVD